MIPCPSKVQVWGGTFDDESFDLSHDAPGVFFEKRPGRVKRRWNAGSSAAINTIRRVSGMVGVFNWMVEPPAPFFFCKTARGGAGVGEKNREALIETAMKRERERERDGLFKPSWIYFRLYRFCEKFSRVRMNWVVLMIVYDIISPSAEIGDQGNKPKSRSRKHRLLKRSNKFVRWIFPWQYIHRSRMYVTRVMDKPLVRYDGNRNWTSLDINLVTPIPIAILVDQRIVPTTVMDVYRWGQPHLIQVNGLY